MEDRSPGEMTYGAVLSRILLEVADTNAFLLTLLDVQARLLACAEGRDPDTVVDEVSALLRAHRRAAIQDIEEWGLGTRTPIEDP